MLVFVVILKGRIENVKPLPPLPWGPTVHISIRQWHVDCTKFRQLKDLLHLLVGDVSEDLSKASDE